MTYEDKRPPSMPARDCQFCAEELQAANLESGQGMSLPPGSTAPNLPGWITPKHPLYNYQLEPPFLVVYYPAFHPLRPLFYRPFEYADYTPYPPNPSPVPALGARFITTPFPPGPITGPATSNCHTPSPSTLPPPIQPSHPLPLRRSNIHTGRLYLAVLPSTSKGPNEPIGGPPPVPTVSNSRYIWILDRVTQLHEDPSFEFHVLHPGPTLPSTNRHRWIRFSSFLQDQIKNHSSPDLTPCLPPEKEWYICTSRYFYAVPAASTEQTDETLSTPWWSPDTLVYEHRGWQARIPLAETFVAGSGVPNTWEQVWEKEFPTEGSALDLHFYPALKIQTNRIYRAVLPQQSPKTDDEMGSDAEDESEHFIWVLHDSMDDKANSFMFLLLSNTNEEYGIEHWTNLKWKINLEPPPGKEWYICNTRCFKGIAVSGSSVGLDAGDIGKLARLESWTEVWEQAFSRNGDPIELCVYDVGHGM
ncbi:hypothetical protein BJ508DRAFT_332815 [Ascobolus immersus RN42]|uniref:Uncharacterized protein n=1 Tax=Ascobolus immersus RN42 TaxID=1160509 RepID=A0A3N4HLM4_ASCIM|nr:hypothetical protein BJ508DRAFT_332815 [Ascobolus immersus RN42]